MSLDIAIYEKKSTAREKLAVFARKQKIGRRITVGAAAASLAALAVPMLRAYDAERVSLLLILFASWIVFAAVVRIACGSLLCRSLAAYFRWSRLAAKFHTAEEVMKKTEEPFSQSPIRMFFAGIRCNPTIGVAPFSLFQAVSLYSCEFALILAIRLLISSSVGMSISPIAVK